MGATTEWQARHISLRLQPVSKADNTNAIGVNQIRRNLQISTDLGSIRDSKKNPANLSRFETGQRTKYRRGPIPYDITYTPASPNPSTTTSPHRTTSSSPPTPNNHQPTSNHPPSFHHLSLQQCNHHKPKTDTLRGHQTQTSSEGRQMPRKDTQKQLEL
jgi:hypothetical protein